MLPKKYRGLNQKEIQYIFKKGQMKKYKNLLIKFVPNNLKRPRLALIAGSNDFKKAAERSSAKRLISQVIEKFLPKLENYDIIVLLKKYPLKEMDFQNMTSHMEKILNEANLLKK